MEVVIGTRKLEKVLNDQRLLIKEYGLDRTKRINRRLFEFLSVANLSEIPSVPPPRCHKLHGNLEGKFAVDVSKNFRMIFEGYDDNDQLTTDRSKVVTVQIIEISDYH